MLREFVGMASNTRLVVESDADYRKRDALNASGIKSLLKKGPAGFLFAKNNGGKVTPAMEFGTLYHCLLLQPNLVGEMIPKLSKATQAKLPEAQKMVEMVYATDYGQLILNNAGHPEVTVLWEEPCGTQCKARIDYYLENQSDIVIIDIKTTKDNSESSFSKDLHLFGYDIQERWYRRPLEALGKNVSFVFLAQEKEEPYDIEFYDLDLMCQQSAEHKCDVGLSLYRRLLSKGPWKKPTLNLVKTISTPSWAKELPDERFI